MTNNTPILKTYDRCRHSNVITLLPPPSIIKESPFYKQNGVTLIHNVMPTCMYQKWQPIDNVGIKLVSPKVNNITFENHKLSPSGLANNLERKKISTRKTIDFKEKPIQISKVYSCHNRIAYRQELQQKSRIELAKPRHKPISKTNKRFNINA
mgnify:CR=1 FL=1